MFQKLRIQLTVLCSAVTALILAVLTFLCLYIFETGIRRQEEHTFQSNLNTMYQNLQQQTSISHGWLRQMEYHYQFSLRLLDNGKPLFFQNFSEDETTGRLLDQASGIAAAEYGIDVNSSVSPKSHIYHREFSMREAGQTLSVSVALIPRSGGTLGVVVLHPLTDTLRRISISRTTFLLGDLAALAALSVFFWFFIARMLKPLQENRKKQIQFITSASHELRSPLAVILSNVDAVRSGSMPADSHFLDSISAEGTRMSRLISDMLQLAGAENHTWSVQLADIELDTLLLQVWESFEPMARAKNLQWSILLPEAELPLCRCDGERIRQLLAILIDNAFCYTPAGGQVCISLENASDFRITVSDNGPGIADDQKETVFERFYCVDPSRGDKAHFGLGLCIAREIIKLHKGQLLLTDTPGGGATFTVILPSALTH